MPDVLLATKLHILPLHSNLVRRPRLIQRLDEGLASDRRLILISAPAGYGKSTLLSDWASLVRSPVAWLSLGAEENIPARFWTYFIAALSSLPALHKAAGGESLLARLQSLPPPPGPAALTNLMNELSQVEEESILVLDDLHNITDRQIHQDLVFLINALPRSGSRLHLVVASRMDPPWPLARWRGRGELSELRSADLRFSSPEAAHFLDQVFQLKLSAQEIAALQERIEGWIVGLQMAAVSMQVKWKAQGAAGVASFIATLSGSHRFILDYLMDEVITQQSVEMRGFLQATSILEQFTAPLCDALLERQDSQAMLELVEQSNLFLIPLDDERQWYRYHHLFADLLRKSLKQTQPSLIGALHQRASDWYVANGMLAEAISHALDAGDVLRVNKLVSGNALAMTEHAELREVLRHFERMSEAEICSRPWLCVAYAWVKAYVDPTQDIGRILTRAMESLSSIDDILERQHLINHLDAIWAYVAWIKGEADRALEFSHTALNSLPNDDWAMRAHLLNIEGLAFQYLKDLPAAIRSFEAAVAAGERTGKISACFFAYTNLAFTEVIQGRLHRAYALCQQVLSLAEGDSAPGREAPVLAYAYATLSLVQLEWNQVDAALVSARQAVALAERWRQADTLHYSLSCLSKACCAAGDLEEAFAANRRTMQLAANVSPWFFRLSAVDEVFLNLEKGDLLAAARRFEELEALVDDRNEFNHFLVLKAALRYAQHRYAELVAEVETTNQALSQKGMVWFSLDYLPLQALALHALGREDEAIQIIERCLSMAKAEGFTRVFVRHGAAMLRLLQAAAGRGIELETIHILLPAFGIGVAPAAVGMPAPREARPPASSMLLVEPLSARELQVLRLLDSPLTSEEIGRELFVSANTVRTHIRNIYGKLDAHGRLEAIQKARNLKLI